MLTTVRIRRDFPSLAGRTYLNTAAEGVPPLSVGKALAAYWSDKQKGMDGRAAHYRQEKECREVTARMLGRTPDEIGFCSCSAEAYNLLATALRLKASDEVVINDLDFPSGATPWLVQHPRPRVKVWHAVAGKLEPDRLARLLSPRTRLVQLSLVSFVNGHRVAWRSMVEVVRAHAPQALIAVDVTQALGRCVLDSDDADLIISSTHKWALGVHGGGIVAVRAATADRLTTRAGGWHHLTNAFQDDRFHRADVLPGAASYAVGMPSFAPIYALNAGLRYLERVGVDRIAAYADPLVGRVHAGLHELGLTPLAPFDPTCCSGIVAFRHPAAVDWQRALHRQRIHVMQHDDRIRIAVHGYNTADDIDHLLQALRTVRDRIGRP